MSYNSLLVIEDMKRIINNLFLSNIDKKATVMITGCNGMIATYLLYFFMYINDEYGFEIKVYALTRNMNKTKLKFSELFGRTDLIFLEHDVSERFEFDFKVDYIFHFASNASPQSILKNPVDIIKANTLGTINIMEYAKNINVKKVVFSSTREVYGKMNDDCIEVTEESLGIINQLEKRACYPESKKMAECIINSYNLQYNIPYVILRIAHCYGPGMAIDNDGRVMSDLIGNVVNGKNIVLKSDGSAVRGFCYISDLISAIMFSVFVGEDNEVYNVCNEEENISILDLANKLIELFPEKKLTISYKKISLEEKKTYCQFKRVRMNNDKLKKIGWEPLVSLEKGLKNTVSCFSEVD